jgi:hypothetical protein
MFKSRKLRDHRRKMIASKPIRPWDHAKGCSVDQKQRSLHKMLASDLTNWQIARRCGISIDTVVWLRSLNSKRRELLKDTTPSVVESH